MFAAHAAQNTVEAPEDWTTNALTALMNYISLDLSNNNDARELAQWTYCTIRDTIPLNKYYYYESACNAAQEEDFQAVWTLGTMAMISKTSLNNTLFVGYVLKKVATRRALISSLVIDSFPPIKYIGSNVKAFTPDLVKVVGDKIFADNEVIPWVDAPYVTKVLAQHAVNSDSKKYVKEDFAPGGQGDCSISRDSENAFEMLKI